MISLILAAGNGTRFADYPQPKPLLPMPDGRPLIAWVRDLLPAGEQVAVVRQQDAAALHPWIDSVACVALDRVTGGPLASALAARAHLYGELLIVYCDVLLDYAAFVRTARSSTAPHACVTFTSRDPRYGYWDGGRVAEKQVIGRRAVSGAFYFRDADAFIQRAAKVTDPAAGVPALLTAETFCYHDDSVVDVGAPADYEAFLGTEVAAWPSR